jgi:hypothetical protein
MEFRYAFPTVRTTNFGDYVIHFAIERMLARFLPPPAAYYDPATGQFPAGDLRCLLLPGITHLTAGAEPMLEHVGELPYPTYCLSGCIWGPMPAAGLLLRTRVLRMRQPIEPDLRVARLMRAPIGARDPHTFTLLRQAGLETFYTGCATLFLPPDGVGDDGYVLFSLGRGQVREQTRAAKALSRRHSVVGICHELGDIERYRAAGWDLPLINWQGDVELYLSYFKRARVVVTGRLHGALPGLAYGKRIFYFGTRDTRTTILDDLGVTVHGWSELDASVDQASSSFNHAVLDFYRRNWDELLKRILLDCARWDQPGRPFGLAPSVSRPSTSTSETSCVHA